MTADPYASAWHFKQMRRSLKWTGIIAAPLGVLTVLLPVADRPFAASALFVVVAVGSSIVVYHMLMR